MGRERRRQKGMSRQDATTACALESLFGGVAAVREIFCVLAVVGVTLAAQEPAFTVASIKINNAGAQKKAESAGLASAAGGVIEPPRGGRVVAQAATARVLIRYG